MRKVNEARLVPISGKKIAKRPDSHSSRILLPSGRSRLLGHGVRFTGCIDTGLLN